MKKTLSALALCILAQQAHAGLVSQWDLVSMAKDTQGVKRQESVRRDVIKSEKSAAAWLSTWANYEKQSLYSAAWPEIGLNLLRWSLPEKSYEWRSAVRVQGLAVPVYQQDSLVDLERAKAYSVTYPQTTGSVHAFAIADTSAPNLQLIATSERRLTLGIAPIGPDNAEVLVCRLGTSSMAPYLEMSETQRTEFVRVSGLSFSSCLVGAQASAYWQSRYHDYVRKDFTHTDNLNPGSSW